MRDLSMVQFGGRQGLAAAGELRGRRQSASALRVGCLILSLWSTTDIVPITGLSVTRDV